MLKGARDLKILAISLLRIGDVFMHQLLIDAVRKRYPSSKIDILVNDVSKSIVKEIENIQKVLVFPRLQIQKHLVEPNRSADRGFELLNEFVSTINNEKYDLVLNLTHTLFSARLMDLIQAKKKMGVHFENGKRAPLQNNFSHYFNDYYSQCTKTPFHYMDLLSKSFDFSLQLKDQNLVRTKKRIAIQVLTSDEKKNWNLKNFVELASLLKSQHSDFEVVILGAPDEEDLIRTTFGNDFAFGFYKWHELREFLKDTRLLLTGDTSVQHFATLIGTPVVSLFIGSANPNKTAPFQHNAIVLQPFTSCSPCAHSSKCTKSSHLCSEQLAVEDVFKIVHASIMNQVLPHVNARTFQVKAGKNGIFQLAQYERNPGGRLNTMNIQTSFEQLVWQIYLDKGHLQEAGPYGSSAHIFLDEIRYGSFSEITHQWLKNRQERNENDQIILEEIERSVLKLHESIEFENQLEELYQKLNSYLITRNDTGDYFYQLKLALRAQKTSVNTPFLAMKYLRLAIQETRYLLQVENKLNRTITSEVKERGFGYVSRARELSELSASSS